MSNINLYKWKRIATQVNCNSLIRYHITTTEALKAINKNPNEFSEFSDEDSLIDVDQYIDFYLVQHNYSSLLLTYATFEEIILGSLEDLKRLSDTNIDICDIKGDNAIRKYKNLVEKHCRISSHELSIDWLFFEDFLILRNFIIHANGNLSKAKNKSRVMLSITRSDNKIRLESSNKLIVEDIYVFQCLTKTKKTSALINDYIISKLCA